MPRSRAHREMSARVRIMPLRAGVNTVALLTNMRTPLGLTAGNAIEAVQQVQRAQEVFRAQAGAYASHHESLMTPCGSDAAALGPRPSLQVFHAARIVQRIASRPPRQCHRRHRGGICCHERGTSRPRGTQDEGEAVTLDRVTTLAVASRSVRGPRADLPAGDRGVRSVDKVSAGL